jgi:hypothetical protein
MKFANSQFEQITKTHPEWSSWTCFCETIKGKGYKKGIIERKFKELVDREDWGGVPKEELLEYLIELSN